MSHLKHMPAKAEIYCPQYLEFDRKARENSKIRFKEHVTDRRQLLVQCMDPALAEIRSPVLALEFGDVPTYIDDNEIMNKAINTMNKTIDKWDGVQFSKQFIKEFNKTGKQMEETRFATIAKNHQDQTSWKIMGNKFFGPYIERAREFIRSYCQYILNVTGYQRQEMVKLGCIAYAVSLLEATIRFHRTKAKPLIRYKTLVRSQKIHDELEKLYSELTVRGFIAAAKKRRKAKDGKTTVMAEEFHQQLLRCCKTLYRKQKQTVYNMFNIPINNNGDEFKDADDDDEDTKSVYPADLLSETDTDSISTNNGTYKEYKRPYESTSTFSHSSTISTRYSNNNNNIRSRSRSGSPREFQRTDPREYSIRNDMNQNRLRRDRRNRSYICESLIQSVRSNHNNYEVNNQRCPPNTNHYIQSSPLLPDIDVDGESVQRHITSITRPTFVSQPNNNMVGVDCCCFCGQVAVNCNCNNNDDQTTNSNLNSLDVTRECEKLRRENAELRRQRDECRILLQQMSMQSQHQQQYLIDNQRYIGYPQPQYVNISNDLAYYNALPAPLRMIQPNVIIRGSSLNDNNMDLGTLNVTPFIDNNNGNHDNRNSMVGVSDIDTPSLPN